MFSWQNNTVKTTALSQLEQLRKRLQWMLKLTLKTRPVPEADETKYKLFMS